MMVDSGSSDTLDPLAGFSVTSLLPRTFKSFPLDSTSRCNNEDTNWLDAHLTAMELKNPDGLLEAAKSVLGGSSEILNMENETIAEKEAQICKDVATGRNLENPQARRPALGRKRARFSFKPDTSQTVEIPEIRIDQFDDPVKYFAAVEKMENAKREVQRMMGIPMTEVDHNVPVRKRPRRPGLSSVSRKSASYKHLYSVALSDDDQNLFSSQEDFSQASLDAADNRVGTETTNPGSAVGLEKKAPQNLDQLEADDHEDSEDDELIKMLQERFKPIEMQKSSLPSLHEVRRSEYKPDEETSKRRRDSTSHLSDISNVLYRERSLGCNKMEESYAGSVASPSLVKSPAAGISLLKKRLFQCIPDQYAFKATDIDLSPLYNSSMNEKFDELSNEVGLQKLTIPKKSNSLLQEKENNSLIADIDNNFVDNGARDAMMEDASNGPPDNAGYSTSEVEVLKELVPEGAGSVDPNDDTEGVQSDQHTKPNAEDPEYEEINQHAEPISEHPEPEKTAQHAEPNSEDLEPEKVGQLLEAESEEINQHAEPISEHPEPEKNVQHAEPNSEDPKQGKVDQLLEPIAEDPECENHYAEPDAEDLQPEKIDQHAEPDVENPESEKNEQSSCIEQPPKTTHEVRKGNGRNRRKGGGESVPLCDGTEVPANRTKKAKAIPPESKRNKPVLDTKCLRRSTRVRTRPLEYWKGEKLLFARVDDDDGPLAAVGAKIFSPDRGNGQPRLKVKSYVSDEYKHLVENASFY